MAPKLPYAVPKHVALAILEDSIRRKEKSRPSVTVSVTRLSIRSLDPGNLENSPKAIIDCLRNCGLIEDDSQEHITLKVTEAHVSKKAHQGTLIEIEYLE